MKKVYVLKNSESGRIGIFSSAHTALIALMDLEEFKTKSATFYCNETGRASTTFNAINIKNQINKIGFANIYTPVEHKTNVDNQEIRWNIDEVVINTY